MFLAKVGEYEPCGMFTKGHIVLLAITIISIIFALKHTIKKDTKNIIKICTIFIWIFEVIIIAYKIAIAGARNVNDFLPLYYCSMFLYAGVLSSCGKGRLERIGNVFLATGGIIGGIVFSIFPTTTLLTYPAFHLVSVHSYIYHGTMIYLGLLINLSNYIKLNKNDIINYASIVGTVCIFAYIINQIFDSNLMFISKNFATVPLIQFLYKTTGRFFTPVMILAQCTLPFYVVYMIIKVMDTRIYFNSTQIIKDK